MKTKTIELPTRLFRTATFKIDAVDPEKRTVNLSLSSEEPYQRYFGNEILDHDPKSIRMSRMENGAALLFNHNPDIHLGKIVSCKSDGKCLRAVAEIGKNADAENRWEDIKSGVLHQASIGYQVHKMQLENEDDEKGDSYRITDWEPHEGSLVTVAADTTVGIGRAAEISKSIFTVDTTNKKPQIAHMDPTNTAPNVDPSVSRNEGAALERSRIRKITDYAGAVRIEGMKAKVADLARAAIDNGTDFDTFRHSVLENWDEAKAIPTPNPQIGMSRKELRQYSLVKAIREAGSQGGLQGLEREASDAAAKQYRRNPGNLGFIIPEDWSCRSLGEINGLNSIQQAGELERALEIARHYRALSATTATAGGYTIGTDLLGGSMIDLLRNQCLVLQLGATHLTGLIGNIAIPKVTGGATCYWIAESGSATPSDQTFLQLGLTPKKLTASTAYGRELLNQSSISIEAFVRDDQARQIAVAKDAAAINGTGMNGQPLGILNTPLVQSVNFGGAATWTKVVSFETLLGQKNADQLGKAAWLTTPGVKGAWKTTSKTAAGYPVFLWENDTVNGYEAASTNNVPSNLVIFGVFSELIIADFAGINVTVDPYSLSLQDQIRTTVVVMTDNGLRHEPAFVVSADSGAQ